MKLQGKILLAASLKKEGDLVEFEKRRVVANVDYARHKSGAEASWRAGNWNECRELLDLCIALNGDCEVLHNFRSRVQTKSERLRESLEDAYRAVDLWPRAENLLLLSRCLHSNGKLLESGERAPTAKPPRRLTGSATRRNRSNSRRRRRPRARAMNSS